MSSTGLEASQGRVCLLVPAGRQSLTQCLMQSWWSGSTASISCEKWREDLIRYMF